MLRTYKGCSNVTCPVPADLADMIPCADNETAAMSMREDHLLLFIGRRYLAERRRISHLNDRCCGSRTKNLHQDLRRNFRHTGSAWLTARPYTQIQFMTSICKPRSSWQDRNLSTCRPRNQVEPALRHDSDDETHMSAVDSTYHSSENHAPPHESMDAPERDGQTRTPSNDGTAQSTPPIRQISSALPSKNVKSSLNPEHTKSNVDGRTLITMAKTLRAAREAGLPDTSQPYQADLTSAAARVNSFTPERLLQHRSQYMLNSFTQKKKEPLFRERMIERLRLPVMDRVAYAQTFRMLEEADVIVITGHTGSGKTTQVPQIILDHAIYNGRGAYCNIVCTQPRRISATSIARRVAYERCEPVGQTVGYHVRFNHRPPWTHGSILYCTAGILLKQLQDNPDHHLDLTSHIVVDEVHERSLATDYLLTYLRELINIRKRRKEAYPKLILMSATIDSKDMAHYFRRDPDRDNAVGLETRYMDVKGRMFPVETHFLGDFLPDLQAKALQDSKIAGWLDGTNSAAGKDTKLYLDKEAEFVASTQNPSRITQVDADEDDEEDDLDHDVEATETLSPFGLAAAATVHVANESTSGDILVFLPGLREIDKVAELLTDYRSGDIGFFDAGQFKLFKLHSTLDEINDEVFKPVASGCRRIVLSTNIAESSITLPNVEQVIDMAKVRTLNHDHLSGDLEFTARWISKADSKQRRGRAGRVQPGHYYALFTQERYESLDEFSPPEITKVDLTGACLEVVAQKLPLDAATFLSRCPTPPKPEVISTALSGLKHMGAITSEEELTALGRTLSLISLEPVKAKAILLGILFSCLEPMLIMACQELENPIVYSPVEGASASATRRKFAGTSESDLISDINAFKAYDAAMTSRSEDELNTLVSEHYIRPYVYHGTRLLANQVYEQLAQAQLVPALQNRPRSVFPHIPAYLNVNSENIPLIKALLMKTLHPNIGVSQRDSGVKWLTRGNEKALLAPRTLNRQAAGTVLRSVGRIRKAGDLLAYGVRRDVSGEKYPWIQESSMITPLMALLFGTSAEKQDGSIRLNNMLDIELDVQNNKLGLDTEKTNTLVLEFRKAIDRFCMMAFDDLRHAPPRKQLGKEDSLGSDQVATPRSPLIGSKLKEAVVQGVAELLKTEDDALQENFRRQKEAALLEDEERVRKQEEKRKQETEDKQNKRTGSKTTISARRRRSKAKEVKKEKVEEAA